MRIKKVTYQIIQLPLLHELSHSQKIFKKSEGLLFMVEIDGVFGVGECAPRAYVTGETIESVAFLFQSFVKKRLTSFSFTKIDEVEAYLDGLINGNYALKAGIEIALLDALGKMKNLPIYKLLFKKEARRLFRINGGAPFLGTKQETAVFIKRFYNQGVKIFKFKVGKDIKNDLARLQYLRKQFPDIRIRIDVNGVWDLERALQNLSKMKKYNIDIVEEPVGRRDFSQLKHLKERINIPIMVDESLVSISDAITLASLKACSWFNIRLSKNGGFLKANKILEIAKKAEIKTQIGAHFGEGDVLDAAKRHFAFGVKNLDSFEGGTVSLLKEHITTLPLSYNDDLAARIDTINKPGLGISLKQKYLDKFR